MSDGKIYVLWKLISLRFVIIESGESRDTYGANPLDYLFVSEDGHMLTVIASDDRESATNEAGEAALFRTMMAYCGPFRIEGENKFITNVEVAWHPGWVGTEQARTVSIDNDTLLITTAEGTHPMFPGNSGRGVLEWQRATADASPRGGTTGAALPLATGS